MFQANSIALTVKGIVLMVLICSPFFTFSQGRKIDSEIIVLTPMADDTVISRTNGIYMSRFIIKNNGPDTIKPKDAYTINITFGNVVYNPISRYFNKIFLPKTADTVEVSLKMTWDTDNYTTTFCGTVKLFGYGNDSIKKESKSEIINNKFCQNVAHKSRLYLSKISLENVVIYPIPSKGVIHIDTKNNSFIPSIIKVTNSLGQLIRTIEPSFINNTTSIDLSDIAKGLYYIQLSDSENKLTRVLILN